MLRFLAVIALSLSAYAAAPHVTPEFPLTPADTIPALGNQYVPAIASRGEDSFAVWVDYRAGGQLGSLLGSRVAADGTFLDPHGIIIDTEVDENPEIVWTGSEYLIVIARWDWYEDTYLPTWAHRIKPDGTRAGEPVFIGNLASRRLFGNGREAVLVAYTQTEAFFGYLDPEGRIRQKVILNAWGGLSAVPDGDDWIVFLSRSVCDPTCGEWIDQLVMRDGKQASKKRLTVPLSSFAPYRMVAATDGDGRFLLFWNGVLRTDTKLNKYAGAIQYIVTDRDANVLAPPRTVDEVNTQISTGIRYLGASIGKPDAAWYGDRFIGVWPWFDGNGRTEIRAMSANRDGIQLEQDPIVIDSVSAPISDGDKRPVLAATTAGLNVLWANTRAVNGNPATDIVGRSGASLAELGTPAETQNLIKSASMQGGAEVAAGDDAMFVVWGSENDESRVFQGRLIRYDGGQSPVIAISKPEYPASAVGIAYGGGVWLVAWSENVYRADRTTGQLEFYGLRFLERRYDRNGNALDAEPVLLSEETYAYLGSSYTSKISVASSGSEFLITWPGVTGGSVTTYRKIRAMRIGIDGTLIDTEPRQISSGGSPRRGAPNALWTGSDYFLLWQEDATPDNVSPVPLVPVQARSARMSTSGVLSGGFPELISSDDTYDIRRSTFEAATNGTEVLVTWTERFQTSRGCVYAQRFTFDGAPLSAKLSVMCGKGFEAVPQRSFPLWDGTRFLVVYSHDDAMWAHALDGSPGMKLFETTGGLWAYRPLATPVGIVFPYMRSDAVYGSIPRMFRRMVSFEPPRRRAVR